MMLLLVINHVLTLALGIWMGWCLCLARDNRRVRSRVFCQIRDDNSARVRPARRPEHRARLPVASQQGGPQ